MSTENSQPHGVVTSTITTNFTSNEILEFFSSDDWVVLLVAEKNGPYHPVGSRLIKFEFQEDITNGKHPFVDGGPVRLLDYEVNHNQGGTELFTGLKNEGGYVEINFDKHTMQLHAKFSIPTESREGDKARLEGEVDVHGMT
ncbi:hypothetical protein HBO02_06025 [Pseudomonas proteolytica]|uniref:hypothetical protein n=1 Tax=Pseudomonas proteolytica TaxID=219574 RepID=UPI0014754206|nr:hypothetical protein [Pseudomonas proteolytica]NMZ21971.1 hypothetical protein [Pseudomonas proteolytica]